MVAVTILAACGGSPDPATAPGVTAPPASEDAPGGDPAPGDGRDATTIAACDLVSADEIGTAVGLPVGAGTAVTDEGCSWVGEGVSATLTVVEFDDPAVCAAARAADATDLPAVGDDVWVEFIEGDPPVGRVVACHGLNRVTLMLSTDTDEAGLQEILEQLGAAVLERM